MAPAERPPTRPWIPVRSFRDDETGVFPVIEAILVAVLVLSAILFFTSVQRPTSGAEEGGIDLGQVASDTLRLLQSAEQDDQSFEGWVTNLTLGDTGTADVLEEYLIGDNGDGVLPKGARFQLRLDNGVSSLPILPAGGPEAPRGARAAQVAFLPNWATFKDRPSEWLVRPGEVIPSCDPRLSLVIAVPAADAACGPISYLQFLCIKAPFPGAAGGLHGSTLLDLGDSGTANDTWVAHWQATPPTANSFTKPVEWKALQNQVPSDILYGTWVAYTNAACTAGATYFTVVRDDDPVRKGTATTAASTSLTASTVAFTAADVGKPITGIVLGNSTRAIPAGTTITAVTSATAATLSQAGLFASSDVVITVGPSSPHTIYSLELVVWFGA